MPVYSTQKWKRQSGASEEVIEAVWEAILQHCEEFGGAIPSIESVAERISYSKTIVGRAFETLKDVGLLSGCPESPRKLYIPGAIWTRPSNISLSKRLNGSE